MRQIDAATEGPDPLSMRQQHYLAEHPALAQHLMRAARLFERPAQQELPRGGRCDLHGIRTSVDFNSFQVDSLTAPVTNAGQPMIGQSAGNHRHTRFIAGRASHQLATVKAVSLLPNW